METVISGDNEATATVDNPVVTEPAATDAATAQPAGQVAGQSAPGEEIFKGMDPTKLPPELRTHYDNMLRDYRDKTGKLSENIKTQVTKATEQYRKDAELFRQLSGQDEFVKQWNDYVQKATTQQQQSQAVQGLPPEVQERLQKVDMLAQKVERADALESINAFADAVDDKGAKLHPDFDKYAEVTLGTHAQAGEYSLLRASMELATGNSIQEKMENGYKLAKATYDRIFEEGKKAGMGRLQTKAKSGSFAPSSVNAGNMAPRQAKDAVEALKFARQGLEVYRE